MNPVQLLQQKLNLKPDGIIGKKTFAALQADWKLTGIQLAHFLGQCDHETGGFTVFTENLNYSSQGLLTIFPKYYSNILLAKKHHRKAQLIANHVYAGRMGNNQPNDGWFFRGRGAVQLSGRNNYASFAEWKQDPSIITNPDQVASIYAFDSALWFFEENRVWMHAKDLTENTILIISRIINVGNSSTTVIPNGLEDRIKKTQKYQAFI